MSDFYYVTSAGETIDLEGAHVATDGALSARGSGIEYALGYRSIESWSRPARVVKLEAVFTDKAQADRLVSEAIDGDYGSSSPGTFYGDGWQQRGYILDQEAKHLSGGTVTLSLTCALLDGVWRKPRLVHLFPGSGDNTEGTKRYAYKYPYKYASGYGNHSVSVETKNAVAFQMVIFGYVRNPTVRIAKNTYTVNAAVPRGGHLMLDSRDCSAVLVTAEGLREDVYGKCVRGTGEGCGSYAWEKIPAGTSLARWDDTFGFDLCIFEESSAPPYGGGS